ncbi:MAG: hypothetical protein QOI24_4133 [Acidobacteriota bacterium]|jgi:hypothetical protein|nr:hypothetical protein [Acidobacteriota bacterium]
MTFEGEIGEIDLIGRLVELGRDHFTGAIRFESDGIIKIVYFKGGDVLSASTNDRTDSIDEILLRAGKVTREHVKQALAKRKETETLGDALLNLGFITRKELTWARRVQVIGILRSIGTWTTGSFTIVADYLPKRDEGTVFSLQQILVELIVTEQDRSKFEQLLDEGQAVFAKTPDFDDVYRRLGLNRDAEEIVAQVDGTNTAAEVVAISGKDAFNVYKLLHALMLVGVLSRASKPKVSGEVFGDDDLVDEYANLAVGDAADLWPTQPASTPEPEPIAAFEPAAATDEYDFTADDDAPAMSFDAEEPLASPVVPPVADEPLWEETTEVPIPAMPVAEPAPAPISATSSSAPKREEQWGFDEAQIETARRAAVPVHSANRVEELPTVPVGQEPGGGGNLLRAAGVGLVLAIVILGGLNWWKNRTPRSVESATPAAAATRRGIKPQPVVPTPIPPSVTGTTGTVVTAGAITPTATTTSGTAPAGLTITAPPAPPAGPGTQTTITTTTQPPNTASAAPAGSTPRLERGKGPIKITNEAAAAEAAAAAATAANDPLRAKYDAMAREAAANPAGTFAVQFELVCETASLTKAIQAGGNNVWFTTMSYRGKPCYRVFWGRYNSQPEAAKAAGEVPRDLRGGATPVVIRIPRS